MRRQIDKLKLGIRTNCSKNVATKGGGGGKLLRKLNSIRQKKKKSKENMETNFLLSKSHKNLEMCFTFTVPAPYITLSLDM